MTSWPVEDIPDNDKLFYRVNKKGLHDNELLPSIFREREGSMSVDWSKYSTAEETRARAPIPKDNGVVMLIASEIRGIDELTLIHDPIVNNRAHSGVMGLGDKSVKGDEKIRKLQRRQHLFDACSERGWEIHPDDM